MNWLKDCTICNDGLCIEMEALKKQGHSERKASEIMADEAAHRYPELATEFSAEVIRARYMRKMKSGTKRTRRKQTPTEIRTGLKNIEAAIENDEVTDDDIKGVLSKVADKITQEKMATRVGSEVESAIKKTRKKHRTVETRPIDNFYRLSRHALSLSEGLQLWADGTMQPETQDERNCIKTIFGAGSSIIVQYARLGVDVKNILKTFMGEEKKELKRIN
jgi:hypothetical protein